MISTLTFVVSAKPKRDYNTITEGEIEYSAGHYLADQVIPTGFDDYGYNYQGHMFKGSYYNSYAGGAGYGPWMGDDVAYFADSHNEGADDHWAWPYRDVKLAMKWSDVWLSNMDRNDDGKLDRGNDEPYTSSAAQGAWLTNHQSGEYEQDGETIKWNYFVKIVHPGDDAHLEDGVWYTPDPDNVEIGEVIWTAYAIIQQVENDAGIGAHGAQYISPESAGFGHYNP